MVKCYIGAAAEPVVLTSVMVVVAMVESVAEVVAQHTTFRDSAQDKEMVVAAAKLLTKAAQHQTVIVMLDLAVMVVQTRAVVEATVVRIMARVDPESLLYDIN
jgi:hypothetical protein